MIKTADLQYIVIGILSALFVYFFISGLDAHFDNRDVMLCESAKVSGNTEYLGKCACYYAGENIRCIYPEGGDK